MSKGQAPGIPDADNRVILQVPGEPPPIRSLPQMDASGRRSNGTLLNELQKAQAKRTVLNNMSPTKETIDEDNGKTNYGFDSSEFHRNLYAPSTSRATVNNPQNTTLAAANSSIQTRRPSALAIALALNDDPFGYSDLADPYDEKNNPTDNRSCCDKIHDVKDDVVERIKHGCTMKLLFKRLPIINWLPKYDTSTAISDLVAGITVGLTVLPQAIAFANVAGVPAHNGLYSSFFGCFVYTILGSVHMTAVGPTALQSILTRENAIAPDFAILLCFFAGLLQIAMGILQLGFIIDFISGPVSIGFTSAAALIIITTQIKDLLGIKVGPGQFVQLWTQIAAQIHTTRLWDAVMGFTCIIILFLLKNLNIIQIGPKDMNEKSMLQKVLHHTLWLISVARNIIVVIICAVIAYLFESSGTQPFKLTGPVKSGLPPFQPPPFTTVYNNQTYNFSEMAATISSGTFVLGILGIVETIATAKVFCGGKSIDATQEMFAIGISGVLSSFVGAMPISGSLSRGAVNAASGVKTPFGGIYTGVLVLLALAFLTPYFYYIPKASLAAVICMAVYAMVEYEMIKPIWKTKKIDLIPAFATFFCCLFIKLEVGIIIGVAVNVVLLLYATARPKVSIEEAKSISGMDYLLVTPDRALVFPSVEYVKNLVSKAGLKQGHSLLPIVVDATHIQGIDYTAAKGIKSLMDDFTKRKQCLIFFNLKPSIVRSFNAVKPSDFRHCNTLQELDKMLRADKSNHQPFAISHK